MRGTGNRPPFSYPEDVGVCRGGNAEPWQTAPQSWCGRRAAARSGHFGNVAKRTRSDGAKANSRKRNGGSDGA